MSTLMAEPAFSQKTLSQKEMADCTKLLDIAEKKQADYVYSMCGFDDAELAWYTWAPLVSKTNYPKAMYQLCMRHPTNDYADLYCQKSADLGYLPALYEVAEKHRRDGEYNRMLSVLQSIVEKNPLDKKVILQTPEDQATLKAYEDLGLTYLKGAVVAQDVPKALRFLQVAADLGSPKASHALGVVLYWGGDASMAQASDQYWWKAILLGCPAAEENLGLLNLLKQGKLRRTDAQKAMEERMFTCHASKTVSKEVRIKTSKDCDCPAVLAWNKSQVDKPYIVASINGQTAVLQDKRGGQVKVAQGEEMKSGYKVESIRSSAVILTKGIKERHVLLFREDTDCVELCQNPNVIPTRYIDDLPVYHLGFTRNECTQLARSIALLNDPSAPFVGLPECQLQDWNTWGNLALSTQNNKHLYLLANYRASQYLPAYMAEAERLYTTGDAKQAAVVANLLVYTTQLEPTDALSYLKKQQAYCIKTFMHMDGTYADPKLAFAWALAGAEAGIAQNMNMLGVLYAKGIGTERNTALAADWFKKAMDASLTPYTDAAYNLRILNEGKDVSMFRYGKCKEIIEPSIPTKADLINLF